MATPLTSLVLDLVALAIYGPLVVLLHELGHAAFARLGGYRVTDFAVGMGRPLVRFRIRGGVIVHLDRWLFAGGSCTAIPLGPAAGHRAWFHLGGLFFQTALGIALTLVEPTRLLQHVSTFNALVMLHNAIPWRIAGRASDAWYALDAVLGRGGGTDVIAQRPAIERMASRAEQVGSPMGTAYARVCLAWADVIEGHPDRADALFRDDPPETTLEPWVDALYHYVKAEWDRISGRPLGALRTAREAHLSVNLNRLAAGQALLAIAEARALTDLGASAQAERALSRTVGVGGPIGWQAAATLVWASIEGDPEDLERATGRMLEVLNRPGLDPSDGASGLWEAAARLEALGRQDSANATRAGALQLARTTLSKAPPERRPGLVRRMGPVAGLAHLSTAAVSE